MVITENITHNGRQFTRTCSDEGFMIERDGVHYSEAVDPIDSERIYTETDILIDGNTPLNIATEDDYINALEELGVNVNEQT